MWILPNFYQSIRKWGLRAAIAIAVLLAIGGIPLASYLGLKNFFISTDRALALRHAGSVLARSERVSQSLERDYAALQGLSAEVCSQAERTELERVALTSPDFVAVGRVGGNRLLCSSLSTVLDGAPLGPVDFHGDYDVRSQVTLPGAPPNAFMAVEREGFVFLIYRSYVIDIPTRPGERLATYSTKSRKIRTSRGAIDPSWVAAGQPGDGLTFVEGDLAVAVLESAHYPTGTIAALPLTSAAENAFITYIVTTLGIFTGLGVASWILLLARQRVLLTPAAIRRALRNGDLNVQYQPVVDLMTGRWVGAEALLRWTRSDGVNVSPTEIIQVAERARLGERLTGYVLEKVACDCLLIFQHHPEFYISVNLTATDIASPQLLKRLQKTVRDSGGSGRNFQMEITESSLLSVDSASSTIDTIRALGIEVVLDDFGTGFSNLQYLASFALDGLKIDKYFVQRLGLTGPTGRITSHIIELAHGLDLRVVAEGIESPEQAEQMRERGVARGQGWLYSRAKPLECLLEGLELQA